MSRRGRGSTGPGRPAAVPTGRYAAAAPVRQAANGTLVVVFEGDDGRCGVFDVSRLPLPGWHPALAAAFTERTGPAGGLRTLAAASTGWGSLVRLMRFLSSLPEPPAVPGRLTAEHLTAFHTHRLATAPATGHHDLARARLLFTQPALRQQVSPQVIDHLHQRLPAPRAARPPRAATGCAASPPASGLSRLTTGYSDGELARLMAALRADTARIRDRIRAGEDLLRRYRADPRHLDEKDQVLGRMLEQMAGTGQVPTPAGARPNPFAPERQQLAGRLFLTLRDLPPLLLLAAALSERNGETVKELPVAHRLLDGRAVELVIIKRRRGARRWFETVTWDIGAAGRELHTPGGFYRLLLELTARSRRLRGVPSPLLWCVWRNGYAVGLGVADDHCAPFEGSLRGTPILPSAWAANRPRPLLADPQPAPDGVQGLGQALPLQVSFNRIKTSMEVRRTKRMGGHLPSAAKSNTLPVLFRHYLSGDPVITSWAEDVLAEALTDAELAARQAHERAVRAAGGGPRILPGAAETVDAEAAGRGLLAVGPSADGAVEAGWNACSDHDRHPLTGRPCQVSFLDCFHCGNCLITRGHLPRLLGLLDALGQRRRELAEELWWQRYGPAWVAIRQDILTRFTPAELKQAQARTPQDTLLDLVENPWERP